MNTRRLLAGIAGGLAGGILFGAMMHLMGIMGMIAGLVGQDSVGVGWAVHLFNSALFGLIYAVVLGAASRSWGRAVGLGVVYGVIWWVLGALLIMPAWMGMPILEVGAMQWQSLLGHIVYGVTLGLVFHGLLEASEDRQVVSHA